MWLDDAITIEGDIITVRHVGEAPSGIISMQFSVDELREVGPQLIKSLKKLVKDRILAPAFVEALSQAHEKLIGE